MKKENILKVIVILFIIALSLTVSNAGVVKVVESGDPVFITTKVKNETQRWDSYDYHESDDLLLSTDEYEIYLNQTSPVRDTIYLLIF